jgi:hypothetical protein
MFKHLIQKDPEIDKLQANVFGQINDIIKDSCPVQETGQTNEIKFVSFEEALKELLTIKFLER